MREGPHVTEPAGRGRRGYIAADEAKRKKLSGFFVGQIMKASKGQATPQMINQLLLEKLESQS